MSHRVLPAVVVAGTFLVARGRLGNPRLFVMVLLGASCAALAVRYPRAAPAVAFAVVAALPVYWASEIPGLRVIGTPGNIVGLLLLPAALLVTPRSRPVYLDYAFGGYVFFVVSSFALYFDGPRLAIANLLIHTAAPYVATRLLVHSEAILRTVTAAVVGVGAILSLLGLRERGGGGNPFFTLRPARYQAEVWAHPEYRFDTVRAEASFGHPIAFGLFLAAAIVFAIALASTTRRSSYRTVLYAAAAICALALVATLSRGPIAVAGVALTAWLLSQGRHVRPMAVIAVATGAAVLMLATPAGRTLGDLRTSVGSTGEAGESARYRSDVAAIITKREHFSWLGHDTRGDEVDFITAVNERAGLPSIDNQYSLIFLAHGALALGAFTLIGVGAWRTVLRRDLGLVELAWAVTVGSSFIALAAVGLLTQFSSFFWMAIAVVAATAARRSRRQGAAPMSRAMPVEARR